MSERRYMRDRYGAPYLALGLTRIICFENINDV